MNGKARLAKLINEYIKNMPAGELGSSDFAEKFADHLLAKIGVVPPCNIGDTAYMVTNNGDIRHLTVTDIDIRLRMDEANVVCHAVYDLDGKPCKLQLVPERIGKTYFFSLEEAKKALQHPCLDEQVAVAGQRAGTVQCESRIMENER